jgi:hypothetical protein
MRFSQGLEETTGIERMRVSTELKSPYNVPCGQLFAGTSCLVKAGQGDRYHVAGSFLS